MIYLTLILRFLTYLALLAYNPLICSLKIETLCKAILAVLTNLTILLIIGKVDRRLS